MELTETGRVVWLPVQGFDGRYEVSSLGQVRSLVRKGPKDFRNSNPRPIKSYKNIRHGYHEVTLFQVGGLRVRKRLARLVLEVFHGPCPPDMEACHRDGDKDNNCIENLEWNTHLKNIRDKYEHGTMYYKKGVA